MAAFVLVDCEDIRDGIEKRWHLLHVLCGRTKIQGVLQMLTQGALTGSADLKTWFYSTTIAPISSSLPPIAATAPLEEKMWSRCRNEMGYEMDALLKLRHEPEGTDWSLTVESTSESLLGCVSTVLYESARHPDMSVHDALLQAFHTFRISAMQLEWLTMRRAFTETKSRVQIDFWRNLWCAARSGGCGARHLVDWRHPGLETQQQRLHRTDWPRQHLLVGRPSGNVELRVERKFGGVGSADSPPETIALADKRFGEAQPLRFKLHTTALGIFGFYKQAHDPLLGTTRQRWALREVERLADDYQTQKQQLACARDKCMTEFAQLELPVHDSMRLLKHLNPPPIDEFVSSLGLGKTELLQQWLDRISRWHSPLTTESPVCISNPPSDDLAPLELPGEHPDEAGLD